MVRLKSQRLQKRRRLHRALAQEAGPAVHTAWLVILCDSVQLPTFVVGVVDVATYVISVNNMGIINSIHPGLR